MCQRGQAWDSHSSGHLPEEEVGLQRPPMGQVPEVWHGWGSTQSPLPGLSEESLRQGAHHWGLSLTYEGSLKSVPKSNTEEVKSLENPTAHK